MPSRHALVAVAISLLSTYKTLIVSADTFATIGCAPETADLVSPEHGALCGSAQGDFAFIDVLWTDESPAFRFTMDNDEFNGKHAVLKALQGPDAKEVTCPTTCGTLAIPTTGTKCYSWSRTDTHNGDADGKPHTAKLAFIGSIGSTRGDETQTVLCSATCTSYTRLWC